MTIRILHNALESGNSCLFDTEKQCYYELPDTRDKIALKPLNNGVSSQYVWFDYFETVREFLESDKTMAIVIFWCNDRKIVKQRYKVTLIDKIQTEHPTEFFNVEKVKDEVRFYKGWMKNEKDVKGLDSLAPKTGIEICQPNNAYMFYLVKEPDALNGVRVKSVMLLNRA